LRRGWQDQGIREINYLLLSSDDVEVASAKAVAGHWVSERYMVPSDVSNEFRMSLYKDIGI